MMAALDDSFASESVTAEEVRRVAADDTLENKWIRNQFLVSQTGGTTGERAIVVTDRESWDLQGAAIFCRTNRGVSPRRRLKGLLTGEKFRMAMLVAECPSCVTWQSARSSQQRGSRLAQTELLSILAPLDESIARLNQFQPHYFFVYPSYLRAIALARLNGTPVTFDPVTLTVGCEILTGPDRELIQQAFPKSRLINQYGTTECVALGVSCPAGQIHANVDYVLLEPVNAQYQPVPTGVFSDRLLITNLTNRVQPIIRYELSDSIRVLEQPCDCGSPLPVIELRGRADDVMYLVDGHNTTREVLPMSFYTGLASCQQLDFMQLVHVRQNELELRLVPAPSANAGAACKAAVNILRNVLARFDLDQTVQIRPVIVDSIARTKAAGKLKVICSEVDRNEATKFQVRRAA